jgi:hypothetical protein
VYADQSKGQLMESLNEKNSWLIFQVQWRGYHLCNSRDEWVLEKDLGCEAKVQNFTSHSTFFPCDFLH